MTLGGDTGSEARVSSSSGLWAHSGLSPSPLPPGFCSAGVRSPFSALIMGAPAIQESPRARRAESQPRTVMGPAVQAGMLSSPLPSRGAVLRLLHGQIPAGTSAGPVGAQDTICPPSHHRPASSSGQLTQLGVAARTPQHHPAAPALDSAPDPTADSVLPRPQISPWCRPNTPWTTDHQGARGSAIISSDACWPPRPTQGIPILGPTMAPLKPEAVSGVLPSTLSASRLPSPLQTNNQGHKPWLFHKVGALLPGPVTPQPANSKDSSSTAGICSAPCPPLSGPYSQLHLQGLMLGPVTQSGVPKGLRRRGMGVPAAHLSKTSLSAPDYHLMPYLH